MIVTMQDYTITDRAPVLIGYEGENLSRNFTVKTFDDLSAIASIELLIGDVNCGAMTVNNTDDTEITISLDAFMIGRAGYKKAQLIMLDDTGAVVMKSNQFDVLVGASNNPRYFASGEKVKTLTVNIDGRTRQIILPAGFAVSVNGDVAVDHIAFKAPASYGEFDFSAAACRVDWTGVDGTSHTNICTEKDADGNWIWALPTALTRGGEGEIAFSVSYVVTDNGAVTADWNTSLVKFYHLESAKSDDAEEDVEEETTYDRLASAIAAVQAAQASVDDVNAILAGITSATPTVVETVADLNGLDTSKVKLAIVAADGYLYYYNGTAWVSGFAYGGLQEIIAARTDSDGVTHADLKTRLNTAEAQIKEDLFVYNSSDVLAPIATYTNRTLNGITYTWDEERKTCTATGTPTGNTYTNMLVSQDGLPNGIKAGERYYVTFKTTDPNFVLFFLFYNNGSGAGTVSVTGNTYITIPDCDGIIVRLRVMGNINGEATASNIAILTAEPNSVLADKIAVNASFSTDFLKNYQGSNSTINGVSFNWQGGTCTVSGTATARANYNIIDSQQSLLDNMQIGDSFIFACDKTDAKIISQVAFYDSTGTLITSKVGTGIDVPFVIPDNTVGIIVRLYVNSDASVNGTVSNIKLVKLNSKKMSVPLIVSFVDDDTTSDELVTRYHDACCHNGIKGTYAVITKQMEDGKTQASKLLSYEDEGFGMCIHCYQQSGVAEWNTTSRTEAVANACRANLAKGLRQMQEHGFLNFAHWITPGGHAEPDLKETAKMLGCKCLITTNDGRANLMQDINPWRIKRISLRYDDNGTSENSLTGVKNIIDKTVSEGSGWLIITTHFNDGWGSLTWDTTLDDNGYPIGYSRFNEIVQYAINTGLVPMTIPQAWTYYEDILKANIKECNMANA